MWRSSRVASGETCSLFFIGAFRRRPRLSSAEKRSCGSALLNKHPIDANPVVELRLGVQGVQPSAHAAASTDQLSVECFAPSGFAHANLPLAVRRPAQPEHSDPKENRMPLGATVNALHRTFVPRPLPASLERYFVHLNEPRLRSRDKNLTAATLKLCEGLKLVLPACHLHTSGAPTAWACPALWRCQPDCWPQQLPAPGLHRSPQLSPYHASLLIRRKSVCVERRVDPFRRTSSKREGKA